MDSSEDVDDGASEDVVDEETEALVRTQRWVHNHGETILDPTVANAKDAIDSGDIERLEYYFRRGLRPTTTDPEEYTPLHWGLCAPDEDTALEAIRLMHSYGLDVRARPYDGANSAGDACTTLHHTGMQD